MTTTDFDATGRRYPGVIDELRRERVDLAALTSQFHAGGTSRTGGAIESPSFAIQGGRMHVRITTITGATDIDAGIALAREQSVPGYRS